jgi:periplasmic protein TonB
VSLVAKGQENIVFTEYALETTSHNSRRGWTTLFSFAIQALAVAVLLLLPLLSIQGLPTLQWTAALSVPPPAPSPAPRAHSHQPNISASNLRGRQLMMPSSIPHEIAVLNEHELPPAPELTAANGVPGGTGVSGKENGVPFGMGSSAHSMPTLAPSPAVRPVRVSHMMEGNLIHRVQPDYPPLARQARIQGTVVLRAIISREGRIENLQLVSGHPMLVQAAIDAVRQWRYRPYVLNDQPVEVETQITVNFTLAGG